MYYLLTGSSFQLVEATGVIIVGHFSIDGELKKEHYSAKHHNMIVVEGKNKLIEEIIELLSFPGQTVLHLVTKMEIGQGYFYENVTCMENSTGKNAGFICVYMCLP